MINKRYLTVTNVIILIFISIYLYPYLSVEIHPTIDGSAHIYNSRLLLNYFSNQEFLKQYLHINSLILPNELGHFVMAIFNSIFNGIISEKIFQVLIVLMTWHSFYLVVTSQNEKNSLLSLLILPFTYSYFTILGFYNFLLGIPILLYSIYFLVKEKITRKSLLILVAMSFLCYYSHLFIVLTFFIVQFVLYLIDPLFKNKYSIKKLIIINIIPVVLITRFLLSPGQRPSYSFIGKTELYSWIYNLRLLITFNAEDELLYARIIASLLLITSISLTTIYMKDTVDLNKKLFNFRWLIIALIFIVLLFVLPDSDSFSGYFSYRLCFVFFIFLVLYISQYSWTNGYQFIILSGILLSSVRIYNDHKYVVDNSNLASRIYNASKNIPDKSYVITSIYSENWIHTHFANYLGYQNLIVTDENYEAGQDYFPLKWNKKPNRLNTDNCSNKIDVHNNNNYLFLFGNFKDKVTNCIDSLINGNNIDLSKIIEDEWISLYKINIR